MPLLRIKGSPGRVEEIFVADELIGHLASIYICGGPQNRDVREGTTAQQAAVGGVSIGGALSGKLVRVITHGYVSGLIAAAAIQAGDRITCANVTSGGGLSSGAGKVTPINTITPEGNFLDGTFAGTPVTPGFLSGGFAGTPVTPGFLSGGFAGTPQAVSGSLVFISGTLVSGLLSGAVAVEGLSLALHQQWLSGVAGFLGNSYTPAGVVSGAISQITPAGAVSGAFLGTAFNTGRILGRALTSGGMGSGIRALISLE